MSILDSIKNLIGGHKDKLNDVIDSASGMASDLAGDHADKLTGITDMAKDAVDKLPE